MYGINIHHFGILIFWSNIRMRYVKHNKEIPFKCIICWITFKLNHFHGRLHEDCSCSYVNPSFCSNNTNFDSLSTKYSKHSYLILRYIYWNSSSLTIPDSKTQLFFRMQHGNKKNWHTLDLFLIIDLSIRSCSNLCNVVMRYGMY